MDYSGLQDQIVRWIEHDEITPTVAQELIQLAEAEMNREFRVRQMTTQARQDTVAGVNHYGLPVGWLGGRAFRLKTEIGWQDLEYFTPEQADERDYRNGHPIGYSIEGCQFRLVPVPNAVYRIKILYYKKIPALSSTNTTNWLLDLAPDAYLWGSLAKAEAFLRNDERIPLWRQQYARALNSVIQSDIMDRWSHGTLRVRAS